VVGTKSATEITRLIEQVARGERDISEIRDRQLRETVRLALRLHKDPFNGPDAAARNRMRSRVLGSLRPRRPSLGDRVFLLFTLLAKPTPYAFRGIAMALVVVTFAGGAMVASASALPEDALYPVKLATEQVRLALASAPEDRAIVQLSIAEHRLAEATTLAEQGDDDDAVIATSAYTEYVASAAAGLAQLETVDAKTAELVAQMQARLREHRAAAASAASRLGAKPSTANAGAVLAAVASSAPVPSDLTPAAAIAADAASTAEGVASVAERKVTPPSRESARPSAAASQRPSEQSARPAGSGGSSAQAARPAQGVDPRAARAADAARKAAEETKAAAEKAKEGGKKKGEGNNSRR
jgi:hypothetical protein